jgi:multiple sugar transport system substrate-binding protein
MGDAAMKFGVITVSAVLSMEVLAMGGLTMVAAPAAHAACAIHNEVPLAALTAGFQAWKSVDAAMAECGNVKVELDQEFATKEPAAFAANPALYQIGAVANETIVPLANAGTNRPLDDLVARYGKGLSPNQLIKIDGKTMAIAMDVNDQHLMYRKDIFDSLGIPEPKTYADVLAAAAKIRAANAVPYPMGATMKVGWNLATDFTNMYGGEGGVLFGADNKPQVNSTAGIKALETMKALTAYMDPAYLNADSTFVQTQFQQGKIAMANFWGSRAGAMDDPKESTVVGKVAMAAAPEAVPGGKPASAVWWDGMVLARNMTDAQADAAFQVMLQGLNTDMVHAHNDDVVWLVPGFQPGRVAQGVIATLQAGAPPYPSSARMGLLVTALGNQLPDYFTGKLTAEQALASVEDRYNVAAREAGLLK